MAPADRYRLIFERSFDLIVVLDAGGTTLEVSPSCREILGCEPEELVGRPWLDRIHPDDQGGANMRMASALAGTATSRARRRVRHKSGRWIVLDGGTFPLAEEPGTPPHVVGILRDVTELTESERRYRTLLDHAPEAVVVVDVDLGRFVDANPKACELFGADRETLLSIGPADVSPERQPDGRPSHEGAREKIRQAAEGGVPVFEWLHRTLDGRDIPCEVRLVRLPATDRVLVRGSVTDISERKAAEARRVALFDSASVGIGITDTETHFIETNSTFQEMLGYSAEELRGRSFLDFTHPDDIAPNRDAWSRARETGAFRLEKRYLHRDGRAVWVDVSSRTVEGDGTPAFTFSIIQDITERKLLEDELRQAQKMEAIGRLAGGIAHDFNNLLTAITGYAEILLVELPQADPRRLEALEIRNAAERAAALTSQLLAFSRRQMLRPELLDLNVVVRRIESLVGRLIGEDVALRTELDARPCPVRADPSQLEQVLMNLAVNARDAMPRGGELTISTRLRGDHVVLTASDSGIGMDEETKARIFEPFFTTKAQGHGTGLGLATVYGIVEQSGGSVSVESAPGAGATFTLLFPRAEAASEPGEEPVPEVGERGSETILLVEDEEMVRTLARRVLAQHGYVVLEASYGIEALEIVDRHAGPIDMLLTDVLMPGLAGPELAARVQDRRPAIKTLFMSGFSDTGSGLAGTAGGALIDKPFTPDELLRRVRDALGDPGAFESG